jgi:hypothetical protein
MIDNTRNALGVRTKTNIPGANIKMRVVKNYLVYEGKTFIAETQPEPTSFLIDKNGDRFECFVVLRDDFAYAYAPYWMYHLLSLKESLIKSLNLVSGTKHMSYQEFYDLASNLSWVMSFILHEIDWNKSYIDLFKQFGVFEYSQKNIESFSGCTGLDINKIQVRFPYFNPQEYLSSN